KGLQQQADTSNGTGKAQGKAAEVKPASQPGRWVDRDCNAALNMQRIGESRSAPCPDTGHWAASAAATHASQPLVSLPALGLAEQCDFVFDPATQIGVGIDPGITQAVSAASGVWDVRSGQLVADQLQRAVARTNQAPPPAPGAASSAGTSLVANLKHITVTLTTWDAVWEVYLDPKWAQQRLRQYGAQDRALEQFFTKLEEDMAAVSMKRHGRAKQLVVIFGTAGIGNKGGWGADAVLRACCKVVCRPRGTDQRRGRVVLVDEHRTTRPSAASAPKADTGDGDGTGKAQGKAAKVKPAPQPGRWVDRDCNAALNMQHIGESRWRPLELCYWPEQGKLPAKGKEYPGLGYKRLRDKPPKTQPVVAQ
ncbi:hypothetical protein QJQ45_021954, partial [Haematococcus lacustris]